MFQPLQFAKGFTEVTGPDGTVKEVQTQRTEIASKRAILIKVEHEWEIECDLGQLFQLSQGLKQAESKYTSQVRISHEELKLLQILKASQTNCKTLHNTTRKSNIGHIYGKSLHIPDFVKLYKELLNSFFW